jgi:hypothetical protein
MVCGVQSQDSTTSACAPYTINQPVTTTTSTTTTDTTTTSDTTQSRTSTTTSTTTTPPSPVPTPSPSPTPSEDPNPPATPIPGGKGGAGELAACNGTRGRDPSSAELAGWQRALGGTGSVQDIEISLLGSQEYYDRVGDSEVAFIVRAYADTLRLAPSPAQVGAALRVTGGTAAGRTSLARSLVLGRQHESRWILAAYALNLAGRSPTPAEEDRLLGMLPRPGAATVPPATPVASMTEEIQVSPEFFSVAGASTDGFFRHVLQNDLNRSPNAADTTAFAAQIVAMNQGDPNARQRIVHRVVSSREYIDRQVRSLYHSYLYEACPAPQPGCSLTTRHPSPAELSAGLGRLQKETADDVVTTLVASDEYYANHGSRREGFVAGVGHDLLDSTSPPSEAAGATPPALADVAARTAYVRQLVASPAYRGHTVDVWYHLYELRVPTDAERTAAAGAVPNDGTLAAIMSTDEYFRDAGNTDAGFVRQVHGDLLGHPPTPTAEAEALAPAPHNVAWRAKVVGTVLGGAEYRSALVNGAYARLLGRTVCRPVAAGFRFPGGILGVGVLVVLAGGGAYWVARRLRRV